MKKDNQEKLDLYSKAIKAIQDSGLNSRAKERGIEPLQKAMARLAKEQQ